MKSKFLIFLGIFIIISGITEYRSAYKQTGFNLGVLIGVSLMWLFAYWLIRIGMGKKGLIDKKKY